MRKRIEIAAKIKISTTARLTSRKADHLERPRAIFTSHSSSELTFVRNFSYTLLCDPARLQHTLKINQFEVPTMLADGTVEPGFEAVRDAFAEAQAHDEGGAQLCVYRHGRRVVESWAGMDKLRNRPFTADTITILMSCTKAVTAVCVHMLSQRGLIDYDAPVARYWPEFAAKGKAAITVRDILTHRAGLMGFDEESGIAGPALFDWNPLYRGARGHGAVVETGLRLFLSRLDLWLFGRRACPARLRKNRRRVCRCGNRRAAQA